MKILRLRQSRASGRNIHTEKSLVLYVGKVNYLEVGPRLRFLIQSGPQCHVTFYRYNIQNQMQEKEIDVVEELELYSLMISR